MEISALIAGDTGRMCTKLGETLNDKLICTSFSPYRSRFEFSHLTFFILGPFMLFGLNIPPSQIAMKRRKSNIPPLSNWVLRDDVRGGGGVFKNANGIAASFFEVR